MEISKFAKFSKFVKFWNLFPISGFFIPQFWVFKFTSFHNGKTTYCRIEFRENFTWRAPLYSVSSLYHTIPIFGREGLTRIHQLSWSRFIRWLESSKCWIFIKMLIFEKKICLVRISEFCQILPLLPTFWPFGQTTEINTWLGQMW